MVKVDEKAFRKIAKDYKDRIPFLQVAVYVMCGTGFLGRFAAEQPGDFYIDDRVGKRPYPKREIYQAVRCLSILAEENGLNPHKMPKIPGLLGCGVF